MITKDVSNLMLEIYIPRTNYNRIAYIVEYLFETCLGLSYELYLARLEDHVSIKMADKEVVLPCNLDRINQTIVPEEFEITIENKKYQIVNFFKKEKQKKSKLEFDFFCATFWLLTRFEEFETTYLDHHNRFDLAESILGNDYGLRPIIQEYVEVLFALIKEVSPKIIRKDKSVRKVMSHDIDRLYKWGKIKALGGEMSRIITGKSIWTVSKAFSSYIRTKLGKIKDPFDNLNLLNDIYKEQGWETIMYFGSKVNNRVYDHFDYDVTDKDTKIKLRNLSKEGVIIGLHPSYDSYNSYAMIAEEKDRLEQAIGDEIIHSRQHYLRFKNPDTFRILDEVGIEYDSTLGYYEQMGFRCGTSIPFRAFDLQNNQKLKLKEIPLLCMDTHNHQMDQDIENTIQTVERYGGTVMVLIHNSSDYLLSKIATHA